MSILKSFGGRGAINNLKGGEDVTETIGVMRIEDAEPPKLSKNEQKGLFRLTLYPRLTKSV